MSYVCVPIFGHELRASLGTDGRAEAVAPECSNEHNAVMNRALAGIFCALALTCLSPALCSSEPIARIAITTVRDRVMVPVRLNGSNGLSFMLDTGFSMTMIHPELAEPLKLRRVGEITVEGIAGEEKAPTYEGAVFEIGSARFEPRRVAALASDGSRRRRRDGILGSGVFRQFVVEIDTAGKQLSLHAPGEFTYSGKGEIVPLRFRRGGTTPIITAIIHGTNDAPIRGEFEIDTGCDSGICLGHDFIQASHLLEERETRAGAKFGVGGGTTTRNGHLPLIQIGAAKVERPDTDFFLEGSPVDRGLAGHIGMGVLKHFKIIFDYSRRQMILEPLAR